MLKDLPFTFTLPVAGAVGVAAVLVTTTAVDASDFWANTECSGGQCQVEAATPGQSQSPEQPRNSSEDERGSGGASEGSPESSGTGEDGPSCVYDDAEFRSSDEEGPLPVPPGVAMCETPGESQGQPEQEEAEVFEPAALAEQARAVMSPPQPEIGTAPPLDAPRFVNMPAWMWVESASWEPVTATATVSAGSVSVTATPDRVVWSTGDGHDVVCPGPGTVYDPHVHGDDESPDCGHTYTALPPEGTTAMELTATWEWQVTWSASDGRRGDLDALTTASTAPVTVSEIHSVITRIR